MIVLKYVLIARDENDEKLCVVSTGRELFRGVRNRCIAPGFHRFVLSIFAMHPMAVKVEMMSLVGWTPGIDIETLLWVLTASRTEEMCALSPRALAFSFPDVAVEAVEVTQ